METFLSSELPATSGKRSLPYLEARLPPFATASGERSINSDSTVEHRESLKQDRKPQLGAGADAWFWLLHLHASKVTHAQPKSPIGAGDLGTDNAIGRIR